MKRIVCLLITLILCILCFAGCSNNDAGKYEGTYEGTYMCVHIPDVDTGERWIDVIKLESEGNYMMDAAIKPTDSIEYTEKYANELFSPDRHIGKWEESDGYLYLDGESTTHYLFNENGNIQYISSEYIKVK